jgi:hypothetical protein
MGSLISRAMPIIHIQQTPARLGIDADLGTQSIRQPRPTYEMEHQRPQQSIEQPKGELTIDQSKAWDALGLGGTMEMMLRIFGQGREIALQTVARIAEEGDRLAAVHTGEDAIAANASDIRLTFGEYQYAGPASYDNVDLRYVAQKPRIEAQDGKVHVNARVNPVEYEYHRGKLDIYMQQYNKVEFSPPPPPQVDFKI